MNKVQTGVNVIKPLGIQTLRKEEFAHFNICMFVFIHNRL